MTGIIRALLRDKGYGFIRNGSALDYFFHREDVGELWPWLQEGAPVEFEPVPKRQCPKGPRAQSIKLMDVVS